MLQVVQILALLQELEVFGSLLVVLTVQNADGLELGVDVEGIREVLLLYALQVGILDRVALGVGMSAPPVVVGFLLLAYLDVGEVLAKVLGEGGREDGGFLLEMALPYILVGKRL